jgi:hypothetical protein
MRKSNKQKLIESFKSIIGKTCFEVYFSLSSIIIIQIGDKVNNESSNASSETWISCEIDLKVVEFWRILNNDEFYCDNQYSLHDDSYELLHQKIKILEGKKIIAVFIDEDSFNFKINFEDNIVFEEYSDVGNEYYYRKKYSKDIDIFTFTNMDTIYEVSPYGKVTTEKIKKIKIII